MGAHGGIRDEIGRKHRERDRPKVSALVAEGSLLEPRINELES